MIIDKPLPEVWDHSQNAFSDSDRTATRLQSEINSQSNPDGADAHRAAMAVLEGRTFSMNNSENQGYAQQ